MSSRRNEITPQGEYPKFVKLHQRRKYTNVQISQTIQETAALRASGSGGALRKSGDGALRKSGGPLRSSGSGSRIDALGNEVIR